MKTTLIFLFTAITAFAQQGFDIKSLDRLGANAKESTNITLEGDTLKLASSMLANNKDAASLKGMVDKLHGIYVRSFEFEETGKYNQADLEPLKTWLGNQGWTRIVDVKEKKEFTQIWLHTAEGKAGGLAVIAAEPKQVTVVYIDGALSMDDIGKLSGNFGIPDMTFKNDGKKLKPESKKEE